MNCNKCGTANDAGSKFCKECGQSLSDLSKTTMLGPDEHLKVGEFVYLAYRESEAGHLDNAIEACQGALAINDVNPATHALLADLYRRKGDLARAIYECERVVSLNPGSLEDRRKLEQLRSQLLAPMPIATSPARPRFRLSDIRWLQNSPTVTPWIRAVVAFVAVVIVGYLFLLGGSGKNPGSTAGTQGQTQTATGPNDALHGQPGPYGPGGIGPQQPGAGQPMGYPGSDEDQAAEGNATVPADQRAKPGIPSVRLPGSASAPPPPARAQGSGTAAPPGNADRPVIVPIIGPRTSGTSSTPSNGRTSAPADGGAIRPAPTNTRPSQPSRNAEERGLDLQHQGKYDEAIVAYKEALNQTSDSGGVYQKIALSYQRMGQHDTAIENYNRAIKAYRDQLATGRDRAQVDRGIRTCEAGIEVSRNIKR